HTHVQFITTYTSYRPSYTVFFFNDPPTPEIYTLSLHDALPISCPAARVPRPLTTHRHRSDSPVAACPPALRPCHSIPDCTPASRSEEHTSELQSRGQLVCRLLLEKKNSIRARYIFSHTCTRSAN